MDNKAKIKNKTQRGKVIAVIGGAALLIGGTFGVQAIAESRSYQHAKLYFSAQDKDQSRLFHRASWGKRSHHRFENMSDAEIEQAVTRAVKHVAIEIDATDEQTAKIANLLSVVAKDMKPLRNDFRIAGKEMRKLLTAETIDRPAIEKLRAERIAETDRASKDLVNAIADVAEVLTAEQRQTLQTRIEQFRAMGKRWRRG